MSWKRQDGKNELLHERRSAEIKTFLEIPFIKGLPQNSGFIQYGGHTPKSWTRIAESLSFAAAPSIYAIRKVLYKPPANTTFPNPAEPEQKFCHFAQGFVVKCLNYA